MNSVSMAAQQISSKKGTFFHETLLVFSDTQMVDSNFPTAKSGGRWSFDIDHFRKKPSCFLVF